MALTARNASRIFAPKAKNRPRLFDSSSSRSTPMSRLGSSVMCSRPCSSLLSACSSTSTRFNRNFLSLHGSTPARELSSTTKRICDKKINQLCGQNVHGMRKKRVSPISGLAPCLQQASFMSSLLPTTESRSRIFDHQTTNCEAHLTTNAKYFTTKKNLESNTVPCFTHSSLLLPPKSLFAPGNRHRFRITTQDSGILPGRSITVASIGTARSFSSSTVGSVNRFAVTPHIFSCRVAEPSARANISSRNFSGNGKEKSKNPSPSSDNKIQEFMDSTVSTVRTNVGSAEATIKRAVEELSTGDLLSVYGIIFLIVTIAVGPSVIRRLQASDRDDNFIDPEDPVMDLARMIRGEYLELLKRSKGNEEEDEGSVENESERTGGRSSTMGLDRIVADLLKSPQIQEAATNLVTAVIQSSQFKTACQLLLKELLKDLLDDPDTLKQVIHLLQNAIVDEKIREAAIQLATDIFGDDRVLDELVTLVQRLGMEKQVQFATQALLVESAHNALNDPEILDHSMEFATDVVGDDVVQQTAGEALYNTMSYAFRPTLSVLLTLLGLGLIFVSVAAFRNVNETPSDAADRAFFNAVEEATSRLLKLIFLPLDLLIACKDALVSIIFFPFKMISSIASRAEKLGQTLLGSARDWFLWLLYLPAQLLSSLLNDSKQIFNDIWATLMNRFDALGCDSKRIFKAAWENLMAQFDRLWCAVDMPFVAVFFQKLELKMSGSVQRVKIQWIILNFHVSAKILHVEKFAKQIVQEMLRTADEVIDRCSELQGRVTALSIDLQQNGKEYLCILSREYQSLNQRLAAFAIFVEEWIRSVSGIV